MKKKLNSYLVVYHANIPENTEINGKSFSYDAHVTGNIHITSKKPLSWDDLNDVKRTIRENNTIKLIDLIILNIIPLAKDRN